MSKRQSDVAAQEAAGAGAEAFTNHLMSVFGPREDDVAMLALRRIPLSAGQGHEPGE
jgi:hypothetical protein